MSRRAFAARHSRHSDAELAPIENPLNDFPQLGHVGMFKTLGSSPCSARWKTKQPMTS